MHSLLLKTDRSNNIPTMVNIDLDKESAVSSHLMPVTYQSKTQIILR